MDESIRAVAEAFPGAEIHLCYSGKQFQVSIIVGPFLVLGSGASLADAMNCALDDARRTKWWTGTPAVLRLRKAKVA